MKQGPRIYYYSESQKGPDVGSLAKEVKLCPLYS